MLKACPQQAQTQKGEQVSLVFSLSLVVELLQIFDT